MDPGSCCGQVHASEDGSESPALRSSDPVSADLGICPMSVQMENLRLMGDITYEANLFIKCNNAMPCNVSYKSTIRSDNY